MYVLDEPDAIKWNTDFNMNMFRNYTRCAHVYMLHKSLTSPRILSIAISGKYLSILLKTKLFYPCIVTQGQRKRSKMIKK